MISRLSTINTRLVPSISKFTLKKQISGSRFVSNEVNTYVKGHEFENRVAKILKKQGHWNVKQNVLVTDKYGNKSEFDIVYGWPIRHYVECKCYSEPIKLDLVAKFKEVLALNGIRRSRGLFVTNSTYTPRTTTIGIKCIDGAQLNAMEASAGRYRFRRYLLVVLSLTIFGGYYYLYDSLGKPITFLKDAYQNVNYYLDSIRTQKDTAKNKFRSIVAIVKDTYVSMKYSKDQSIQLFKEKKDDLSTKGYQEKAHYVWYKLKNALHLSAITQSISSSYQKFLTYLGNNGFDAHSFADVIKGSFYMLKVFFFVTIPNYARKLVHSAKSIEKPQLNEEETQEKVETTIGGVVYRMKRSLKKFKNYVKEENKKILEMEKSMKNSKRKDETDENGDSDESDKKSKK